MTWFALAEQTENQFSLNGLDQSMPKTPIIARAGYLARGSIVIESRLSPEGRPQTLLSYRRSHPWNSSLSFQAIPGGGIALVITQGDQVFHGALNHDATGRTDVVRITYSWDSPNRWARLAIERPEIEKVFTTILHDPLPLSIADLHLMMSDPAQRRMDCDVLFVALSDEIEPLGPMPGLSEQVPVSTSTGYRLAGQLKRGDLVHTVNGNLVPILQTIKRRVPARGSFAPVRLRAPYFGLRQDVLLAHEQRLVIGGPEVEYLFGNEWVLVPVRHLINGSSTLRWNGPALVTYTQVITPAHEAVLAAGCAVESLYIGRIRRNTDNLAASLLAHIDRNSLPEHAKPAYPVLKAFEAVTLAEQRAA